MRYIVALLFISFMELSGDEIQRIDSIVEDISKLRDSYDKSQDELQRCRYSLKDEQEKNVLLLKEIDGDTKSTPTDVKIYQNEIETLKIKIAELQKRLETNKFPKLVMKDENSKLITFKAATFKLNKDADIYDSVDGLKIDRWEDKTTFTSNQKKAGYIKITGYFVDRVWQPSDKELWIKESDVIKKIKTDK